MVENSYQFMQKEISKPTKFLDDEGNVIESGWARDDYYIYERSKITKSPIRIKEWDFWEVFNDKYCLIMNIFDIGYAGVAQFSFIEFNTKKTINASMFRLMTKGSVENPNSWKYEKPLKFSKGNSQMIFSKRGDYITLKCNFPKKEIDAEITLFKDPKMDSMVNLIPFEDPKKFVYAVKVMSMPAEGYVNTKNSTYKFNKKNNSWGILDWTRAIFPYKNHWKWATTSGIVNGVNFGFNLDYGFGTESNKNMIIYDGKGHHLDKIEYQHDWKNLKKPLKITSNDNRVNLILNPTFSEKSGVDIFILKMKGVKSYGYFTGTMVLDNGKEIEIKKDDKLFGWAEEFFQKW